MNRILFFFLSALVAVQTHAAYNEDLVNRYVPQSVRDADAFTVLATTLFLAVLVALAVYFGSSIMAIGSAVVAKFSDMVTNRAQNENTGFLGVALAGALLVGFIAFTGYGVYVLIDGYAPPTFTVDASG